jgi:hypothetical protein
MQLSLPQTGQIERNREREGGRERGREREKEGERERKREQGTLNYIYGGSVRERKRERERIRGREKEGGRERDGEREMYNMVALFLFLIGMTGALAPFSYLVHNINTHPD